METDLIELIMAARSIVGEGRAALPLVRLRLRRRRPEDTSARRVLATLLRDQRATRASRR